MSSRLICSGRKTERQGAEVVGQLRNCARTDDRKRSVCARPGDGDLTGAGAEFARDGEHGVEDLCALHRVFGLNTLPPYDASASLLALTVLPGQHAAAER